MYIMQNWEGKNFIFVNLFSMFYGIEVVLPFTGATKSRAKKSSMKDLKGNVSASTKRSIRSKRR